jgi:flagellar motility protein MotE (MotC chaperone)
VAHHRAGVLTSFCREETVMSELSKLGKLRMLVIGVLLVKLALLLFLYRPVFWRASPPVATAQAVTDTSPSRVQAVDTASTSRPASPAPPQTEDLPMMPVAPASGVSDPSWESVRQLAAALEGQRAALASKESQLRQEQERLVGLKTTLRAQLDELAAMHLRVTEALKKKADVEEEELKRLARLYESTTPEQGSTLLGKLDVTLAARILTRMNGPKAGKILSKMDPVQAARVSEYLAKKE